MSCFRLSWEILKSWLKFNYKICHEYRNWRKLFIQSSSIHISCVRHNKTSHIPHESKCQFTKILTTPNFLHYTDVIMGAAASQITSLTSVYSTVFSGTDQRKHQSFASLAFVGGIHRSPVNSPHKWPVTQKMFPFDDVIILSILQIWGGDIEEQYYVLLKVSIKQLFLSTNWSRWGTNASNENKRSSIWQLCHHWWHRKLS